MRRWGSPGWSGNRRVRLRLEIHSINSLCVISFVKWWLPRKKEISFLMYIFSTSWAVLTGRENLKDISMWLSPTSPCRLQWWPLISCLQWPQRGYRAQNTDTYTVWVYRGHQILEGWLDDLAGSPTSSCDQKMEEGMTSQLCKDNNSWETAMHLFSDFLQLALM